MKKCVNGVMIEMTQEEIAQMEAEYDRIKAERKPTPEERIAELEQQNAMLLECVLEMSEIVYA